MKYLLLIVISLMAFITKADSEVNVSYLRVNQNLFDTISFPMDAVELSYAYVWDSGVGMRLGLGRSTETANSLFVEGLHYVNKINVMYTGEVFYRYHYNDKHSYDIGIGKTDYKSTWWVNGEKPVWSDGTDSDWSYHVRYNYEFNHLFDLTLGYSDIYRKDKPNYGREETRYYKVGFTYQF